MRKILLLTLCLCLLVSPALGATAGEQEALSRTELIAWRAALLQTLKTLPVQNNPSETNDPNGSDTWLYAYDFGMVELGRESLEGEGNPIESVEVLTTGVSCPRDVEVGDTLETVLAAYPNENPTLSGDASYAALYVREDGRSRAATAGAGCCAAARRWTACSMPPARLRKGCPATEKRSRCVT